MDLDFYNGMEFYEKKKFNLTGVGGNKEKKLSHRQCFIPVLIEVFLCHSYQLLLSCSQLQVFALAQYCIVFERQLSY